MTAAAPVFVYEARTAMGAKAQGEVSATDARAARDAIVARGLTPIRIAPQRARAAAVAKLTGGHLSTADASAIASDLARFLAAGIPLVDALRAVAKTARTQRARTLATTVAKQIEEGQSFSSALRNSGGRRLALLGALAEVGESASALSESLADAAASLRESAAFKARMIGLLIYPAAVAVLTLTILVVFLAIVAPALRPIFSGLEDKLPFAAKALFVTSDAVRLWGLPVLAIFVGGALFMLSSPPGRAMARGIGEGLALSPAALGAPAHAGYAAYARALALALRRGVRLPRAHTLAIETIWSAGLRKALQRDASRLETGAQLSSLLKQAPHVPGALVQLASAGEAAGRLAPAMKEAGDMLADEARLRSERLVALAGPLITITLGGLVGLVVLTLFRALSSIAEVGL